MRAVLYVRVSSERQTEGTSLDSQRRITAQACIDRDWSIEMVAVDHRSAKNMHRPGLQSALRRLKAGELDVMVVARLDRLSRSTLDFADLLDRSHREGWSLLLLDPLLDLTTPFGRAFASMAAIFAELERAILSQRIRDSYEQRIADGTYVYAGGPVQVSEGAQKRAHALRLEGLSYRKIADRLLLEGYTPPASDVWTDPTLIRMITRENGGKRLGKTWDDMGANANRPRSSRVFYDSTVPKPPAEVTE